MNKICNLKKKEKIIILTMCNTFISSNHCHSDNFSILKENKSFAYFSSTKSYKKINIL